MAGDGAWATVKNRIGQIAIPAAIVGIVVMMVVPLPPPLIDLLLVSNIALAVLALAREHVDPPRPRLLDLPVVPPHRDALPARAQRVGHPPRAPARIRGQGDRVVRSLRRRRIRRRRPRDLPHPHRDPVHRDHQRCRTRRRGRGSVHPRRHARKADGDRRRPQLRPHRRDRSEAPPQGDRRRSRLLRRDGRCVEVREGRRDRRHRDRDDQPHRRVRDRRVAEAHVVQRRGLALQLADRRRRAGRADPGVVDLAVVGSDRDPGRNRERPRHRPAAAVHETEEDAPTRRRRDLPDGDRPRPPQGSVPVRGRDAADPRGALAIRRRAPRQGHRSRSRSGSHRAALTRRAGADRDRHARRAARARDRVRSGRPGRREQGRRPARPRARACAASSRSSSASSSRWYVRATTWSSRRTRTRFAFTE